MFVSLGKIIKTQGLRGEFRVFPHGGESANLATLDRVTVADPAGNRFAAQLRSCRQKGPVYILQVEGIDSIEQAERLVGGEILALQEDLEPLPEGEFYWYELVGMEVTTEEGRRLGRVESIIPTGANDVLQVTGGGREWLLPYIDDVVLNVDREAKKITVRLLAGLD
ncbi:MAG: 16S rRNA processing protein RimM [Myxococcales bacterium]|nr:16S rRNA processing protein RimM [Myxococcales bacterium]